MGRRLDILLGRTFKTGKFKTLLGLALSRMAVLKNQRQVRCSQARNDVGELLKVGQQERALLRVEHVIKDQNMLDVFVMIEGYCHLLTERALLIQNQKDCPYELKEAISSMIFAASRIGETPELQEIRWILTARYGKDFAASAVELRNSCGVNPKMIQKMSTKQPSLETRMKVLKEIAYENGVKLELEELSAAVAAESNLSENKIQQKPNKAADVGEIAESSIRTNHNEDSNDLAAELDKDEQFSGSMKARKKYADVATAAQAAFESAAYAAAAARAAVELSRSESVDKGSDDQGSRSPGWRNTSDRRFKSGFRETPTRTAGTVEVASSAGGLDNIHAVQNSDSESENEEVPVKHGNNHPLELGRSSSASSIESVGVTLEETKVLPNKPESKKTSEAIHFDESDEETDEERGRIPLRRSEFNFEGASRHTEATYSRPATSTLPNSRGRSGYEFEKTTGFNAAPDEGGNDDGVTLHFPQQKQRPVRYQADSVNPLHDQFGKVGLGSRFEYKPETYYAGERSKLETANLDYAEKLNMQRSNIEKRPVSVRTRKGFK